MTPTVRVCRDAAALVDAAAALFVESAVEAAHAHGAFSVALSGGTTPNGLYARLATDDAIGARLPWPKIDWWWGDERHVPPDHPDSNYRKAAELLLSRAPIDASRIHRVHAEDTDAQRAARGYERDIRTAFQLAANERPRFDLILLGLGPDGHTASLFPGTAGLNERTRLFIANDVPAMRTTRLTLTYPAINAARRVVFLVSGADKTATLKAVLEGPPGVLPAQRVQPTDGDVIWIVDDAAARELATIS